MSETKTGNHVGCPFSPMLMASRITARSGPALNQFRLREVLRERDPPPEDPDCLGGDCTRGLGERLTDGAGERYVGVVLCIDGYGVRETDREEDRTDGLVDVGEEDGLDRLELQTDGLDALRPLRVAKDPLEAGELRDKLRLDDLDRKDCCARVRVPSVPLLATLERREPPCRTPSREIPVGRDANLEERTSLLENAEFRFHTRERRSSRGKPCRRPPTMAPEAKTRVLVGSLPKSFRFTTVRPLERSRGFQFRKVSFWATVVGFAPPMPLP